VPGTITHTPIPSFAPVAENSLNVHFVAGNGEPLVEWMERFESTEKREQKRIKSVFNSTSRTRHQTPARVRPGTPSPGDDVVPVLRARVHVGY
jgi:hypothetical protein